MKLHENKIYSQKNGHFYFDGKDLTELADEYGTPLYVFSEREIKNNVAEIQEKFRRYHAKTFIHYAAKCESTIANLQVIRSTGCNLEVNSGGELFKGLYADFRGNQIVFNGVSKSEEELEMAIINDVKSINVDSQFELKRIINTAIKLKKKANISLRIVPEVSTGVVKGNETGTHESKFGITLDAAEESVRLAQENSKWVYLCGYHFHIGTQTYDLNAFVDAFRVMLKLAVSIHKKAGYKPEMLNIGGGLPVPHYIDHTAKQYMPGNIYAMLTSELPIESIAKDICAELKEEKVQEWAGKEYADFFKDVELLLEPGRKVIASAAVLVSRIENEKERKDTDERWLMLDAGFNTLMEVKTYFWYYHMVCANKMEEIHCQPFRVAGPCCDSGDVYYDIDYHRSLPDYRCLPESAQPGDLIAMINVGAYGTPNMSNYNGRPKAGVVLIRENGKIVTIKPAQKYGDLVYGEAKL
jgi:diaminopimelate decarboxylase